LHSRYHTGTRGLEKDFPKKYSPLIRKIFYWRDNWGRGGKSDIPTTHKIDDPEIAAVAREFGADVPLIKPSTISFDIVTSLSNVERVLDWMNDTDCRPSSSYK
jgi:hypothetical protein